MRLSFVAIVLFLAMLFWQIIEHNAIAAPKEVEVRKALPMDVPFEKMEARTYLNSIREAMQMQTLIQNDELASASQAHADYLVLNSESSHDEVRGHKNFTGFRPVDRAFQAGFHSSQVSENLSTKNYNARSSVDGLFSAIYHRFGFLSPDIDEIGVGAAQDSRDTANSAFVYVMGNAELNRLCTTNSFKGVGQYLYKVCRESEHRVGKKQFDNALNYTKRNNPKIILYPYDGQDEVPPGFYSEVPDPLPDYEVSGFPVSIEFNDYFFDDVEIYSFELYEEDGEKLSDVRLMNSQSDPHQRFTSKQYALFPLKRLKYDTKYRVEVEYGSDNKKETVVWYFRTQKPTEKFHIITQKEESITIESGRSHIIYFRPLNAYDIVKNIQFPSSIDIQFIDNNTLKLTHMSDDAESFDITSDTRILHIKTISSN